MGILYYMMHYGYFIAWVSVVTAGTILSCWQLSKIQNLYCSVIYMQFVDNKSKNNKTRQNTSGVD